MQSENVNHGAKRKEMLLHFVNGRLRLDEGTGIASEILTCLATIYSEEDMGMIERSDVMIGYNADRQVWVTVQNDEDIFEWGSWETERRVTVLFYILAHRGEHLMFCSNKDFFCYSAIPQIDPRQDRDERIANASTITNYRVIDELLRQTNRYCLKVLPTLSKG